VLTSDLDPDSLDRFMREQRGMGRLSGHPHIAIPEVGTTASGRPFIVMPYHAKDSLESLIRRHGLLNWRETLSVGVGVKLAGALDAAHRVGTLHRDVTPANILLVDYGEPQLTDFGIARIAGGFEAATGVITGSPAFHRPRGPGGCHTGRRIGYLFAWRDDVLRPDRPRRDQRAAKNRLGPAIADDETDLDNAQFLAAVQRAAVSLRGHGVSAGDVVAVMLPNTVNFIVSLFAAWRLGAAITPVNPSLRPAEVTYQVSDAGAKVLIVEETPEFDAGVPVVGTDQLDNDLSAPGAESPHEADDALALLIDAMCNGVIGAFELTDADHSLLILPLFHVNGIVVGTLAPLLAGGRTTVAGRFRPDSFSTGSSRAARRTSPPYQPFTRCCAACAGEAD
jgi:hypothetical protein